MLTLTPLKPAQHRVSWLIFFILWLIYAAIGPGPTVTSPNTVSRLALPFAIIQDGSLQIDRLAPFTIDRARLGDHWYLDKAPGQSFMALPVVRGAMLAAQALGDPGEPIADGHLTRFFRFCAWLVVAVTTAPFAAAAAAAVYRTALRLGSTDRAARFAAIVLGLCTPAFGWGTVLFSHMIAGGCLALAFEAMLLLIVAAKPRGPLALGAGLLMAFAVTMEVVTAIPLILIALSGSPFLLRRGGGFSLLTVMGLVAGGVVGLVPLAFYNHMAFGSVAALGYSNVVGFDGMQSGFFGISAPSAWVFVSILIAPRRGILWLSPILAAAPLAWWVVWRRWPHPVAFALIAVPAFYLLLNSGYFYWDGGESTGPRHIMAALPFICLGFAPLWDAASRWQSQVLVVGAALSAILSLVCASVDMNAPARIIWVLNTNLLPRFIQGDVHGLFHSAGVPGLLSLVPIVGMMAALLFLTRERRR